MTPCDTINDGLVGSGKLKFTRDENGLHVSLPEKFEGKTALALKVRA
jgi:hypothetical protein